MEDNMISETSNAMSLIHPSNQVHHVVGVDDELHNIKDRLTGYPSKLEVISIVGMGGIGKTTLARKLYADPFVADYFDIRGWTSLSQSYQLTDILFGLILQICQTDDSIKIDDLESSSREVGAQLCRGLKGRRYLVMIDDIWDLEAWQKLRIFFPDDRNGSRILLTSRDVNVGKNASPKFPPYELSLMDPETSWELLSEKIFLNYLKSTSRDVGAQLWKGLNLVVLDHVRDAKPWDKSMNFFMNNFDVSGMLLGSSDVSVSKYSIPNYPPHESSLMDADASWELFSKKIFLNKLESTSRATGAQLREDLEERRYLVVIDDICNKEAWEIFRNFVPKDCKVSLFSLPRGDVKVGKYAKLNYPSHELSLMGVETSWELLSKMIFFNDLGIASKEVALARLWKYLKGRRYLVVIDAIWDVKAREMFGTFFSEGRNGSQILFLSRDVDVSKYAKPNDPPREFNLMDPDPRWELLSKDFFLRYFCPKSLVRIGKSIAVKCRGLPLTMSLVADHLSSVGRTPLDWLNVENKLESHENHGSEILALSYNYLPQHLKLCFLCTAYEYVQFCKRLHPEASFQKITSSSIPITEMKITEVISKIMTMQKVTSEMAMQKSARPEINQHFGMPTQRLIRLWIAAGFITADSSRTLEDVAEDCLEELTSRNLVMVTKRGSSGRPKRCIVHDLTIEMCRTLDVEISGMIGNHSDGLYPFALFGDIVQSIEKFSNTKRKHLRYLEISTSSTIPPSVSKFCNLQTFINHDPFPGQNLPREIWLMSQLRHLHAGDMCHFPSRRRTHTLEDTISVLKNLQSVSLSSTSCTREVVEGMPNLRRLKLNEVGTECSEEEQTLNCLNNIFSLKQLQSLRLSLQNLPRCLQHWHNPPPNLKKVTLARSCLSGKDISMLASLSNLQILKLVDTDLREGVLDFGDKIFHKLRVLLLNCPNLRIWKAEMINLPRLQHLVLKNCNYLTEIPLEIGDICTLDVIELHNCSSSSEVSATEIQKEQRDMGNDVLKLMASNESSVCRNRMVNAVNKVQNDEFCKHPDEVNKASHQSHCLAGGVYDSRTSRTSI